MKPETTPAKLKESLARGTIFDYLTVLKAIWHSACDEYNLHLRDPFRETDKLIPPGPPKKLPPGVKPNIPVWRFDDAMKIIAKINPFYRNAARLMFLTGLSASEMAGLRKRDITEDSLLVINFISRDSDPSEEGKTPYRPREIPLTEAIRECLEEAMSTAQDEYLFRTATGLHFNCNRFRDNWESAIRRAGLEYMRPYSTRHTYAAWSLAIGVIPDMLSDQMGHGSKEMVYEVYGKWKKDLQKDVDKIRQFMGEDFGK